MMLCHGTSLKGHNAQHTGHTGVKFCQNGLLFEIYFKGLVTAIGKV